HVHQRQVWIDLPDRLANRADLRRGFADRSKLKMVCGVRGCCRYGTYIVGGAGSRTLSYFASRSTPTISSCPAVSIVDPKRRPIGFSFGKYLRTAVSLMTATFGVF